MIVKKADRLNKVEEYYFSKKLQEIQVMRSQGINVINLGIGSPDLVPPEAALKKTSSMIQQSQVHGYASYRSIPELRAAMADWLGRTYHITLDPEKEVLPLLGSKEGILYLSLAILNPGDEVLIPNPGYPAYTSVTDLVGARALKYDLTDENDWMPDLKKLGEMDLSRCKLMWVNYPHMPTGREASENLFSELVAFGREKKILICNDNPYGLVLNEKPPKSLIEADPKMEVVCELNSLSKSFNMAGWRVGMFLGSSELVNAVISVKSNVDSGMFLPIQWGAIEALGVGEDWHKERNSIYRERRQIIWEIFDLLGYSYSKKQVGLFVWAKAPDKVKEVVTHLDDLLHRGHVFLTPGMIFGSNGNRFARASLCASLENLKMARERVKEFVS